jgi:bacterioferritin
MSDHKQKLVRSLCDRFDVAEDASVYLEEFARTTIGNEELHNIEIKKMLRDFS